MPTSRDAFGRRVVPNSPSHVALFDDDAVAARRAWWRDGGLDRPGHYPGCPCAKCVAGIELPADEVRALWSTVPGLPAVDPGGRWRRRTVVPAAARRMLRR